MASINLSGILTDPLTEEAYGMKVRFTQETATGTTLPGSRSILTIPNSGIYNINLGYGNVLIETQDPLTYKWIGEGVVTINEDTPATDLITLIGITEPATDEQLLVFQSLAADASASANEAAISANEASSRIDSYQVESTSYLINSFDGTSLSAGDVVSTLGFYSKGTKGGAYWVKTGEVVASSQSPSDTGGGKISDLFGNEYEISYIDNTTPSLFDFGGVNDGVYDNALNLYAAENYLFSRGGGTLDIPFGITYTTETFKIRNLVTVQGAGPTSHKIGHVSLILVEQSVSPAVELTGYDSNGDYVAGWSASLKDLAVGRDIEEGVLAESSTEGVVINGIGSCFLENVLSLNHGYGYIQRGDNSLGNNFIGCMTSRITQSHVRIENGPEPTFTMCRFGKNGGTDYSCQHYVEIVGGDAVDTITFLRCQFNQSGGDILDSMVYFENYNDVNGIINFTGCHMEHVETGGVVIKSDNDTLVIRKLTFNGSTINTGRGNSFFSSNSVFERFSMTGGSSTYVINPPSNSFSRYLFCNTSIETLQVSESDYTSAIGCDINNLEFLVSDIGGSAVITSRVGSLVGDVPENVTFQGGDQQNTAYVSEKYIKYVNSLPYDVKHFTGTANESGVIDIAHGAFNSKRISLATCIYVNDSSIGKTIDVDYIDGGKVRFTDANAAGLDFIATIHTLKSVYTVE